jgi:hypothetical protein
MVFCICIADVIAPAHITNRRLIGKCLLLAFIATCLRMGYALSTFLTEMNSLVHYNDPGSSLLLIGPE